MTKLKLPIYMDYNATTPCDPRVVEAMLPYFNDRFGNAASRNHSFGWVAAEAVEYAREQVAALIGADKTEIIFTSGATEADNLALKGVFENYATKGNHIITWNLEHKAVLDSCKHLEKLGADVTYLKVQADGMPDLAELEAAIRPDTILIALMYANNEIGTINPVAEAGEIAKKHSVIFFTDATQAVGKISIDVNRDNIDMLALSAHKFYGPKGVGALYVRRRNPRVKPAAQMDGGGHEKAMRSGTLNVPGIVGMGKAAGIALKEMDADAIRVKKLRDQLEEGLLQMEECYVNGNKEHRLAHVSNLSFKHVDGEALLTGFNKEIALASGAACSSASMEPSYVLKALGLDDQMAYSSIRFSLGKWSSEEEVEYTIERVRETVLRMREMNIEQGRE